jgi:TolA-binding protein
MMNKPVRLTISVLVLAIFVLVLTLFSAPPMSAANKDMVTLQTQVQQLQETLDRLKQSNDERMGLLKDLVEKTADSVNKMSVSMTDVQKLVQASQVAQGGKVDEVSARIQAMNDSIDELKLRMDRLNTALQAIQKQQQSIDANIQNLTPPTALAAPTDSTGALPAPIASAAPAAIGPSARVPAVTAPAAQPVDALYKTALGDYMGAKNVLATSEFNEVIQSYPSNDLAGNAYFYLGEIDSHDKKFANAVKNYDRVLEQFPDNNKIPAAHLHKGEALIALNQRDAGVRELNTLITRFPHSPEATTARSRLNGMGVRIAPHTR